METVGRTKGILEVDGLLKERKATFDAKGYSAVQATKSRVEKHLSALSIKHKHVDVSSGAIPELSIVNMKAGTWNYWDAKKKIWTLGNCHAVVFIRQDGDLITYYAPNSKVIATVDSKWFKSHMDGTCLVLE